MEPKHFMTNLLSLRHALGAAVDELPALAGTKAFADKEREVEDLERTIAELERAEAALLHGSRVRNW
jgi:7-keto-8-aminopelargonate synthetase-like enzyme